MDKKAEVIVKDNGHGMDATEVQEAYLRIGRNRREADGKDGSRNGRRLMGRKGLGKLAAFGVATELQLRTVKNGQAICLKLDFEKMKAWPRGKVYKPEVVAELTGKTTDPNGTELVIRRLHRERAIDLERVRRELARRYTIIGDGFKVFLNKTQVTPKDRRLQQDCKHSWDAGTLPIGNVVDKDKGWVVSGWLGAVEKASQVDRGVDLFARGKAVELDSMFNHKTTHIQFARAYVVGEVHAEFLDAEEDNVSTARTSVQWESEAGSKLQEWGVKALNYVFKQWLDLQQKQKEGKIRKTADFERWLASRTSHEQRVANKLIKTIVQDENIDVEAAKPLLDLIKINVEFQAFQDLVDEIEESGANIQTLLKLFEDWRVIEAREHLKLSDGRLEVMEKLSGYVKHGALEVKQIQPLFERNGWLVNQSWADVTGQNRYTELLRKHCKEPKGSPEENLRIDILGYEVGGGLCVVELKRPEKTLSWDDLEQIEKYVSWARANIAGTGPDSLKYISGLLIVGRLSGDKAIQDKQARLAGADIRVEMFDDLLHKAQKVYGEVERRLKDVAPEYSREARRRRKGGKKS